jgi:hypothetical protein
MKSRPMIVSVALVLAAPPPARSQEPQRSVGSAYDSLARAGFRSSYSH